MKKPLNNYVWDNEKRIKAIQETADEHCDEYSLDDELIANEKRYVKIMSDIVELHDEIQLLQKENEDLKYNLIIRPLAIACEMARCEECPKKINCTAYKNRLEGNND